MSARTSPKRDPAKMAAGKIIFQQVMQTHTLDQLTREQIESACFFMDGQIFLPVGGAKASRLFRAEARKLGIL